jgi:hypothetical protein
MKGYFSQLAQSTGLVTGPGKSSIAGSSLSPSGGERLHFEEIGFTSAPQDAASPAAGLPETESAAQNEAVEAVHFEPVEEIERISEPLGPTGPSLAVQTSGPESNDAASGPVSPVETSPRAPLHIETVDVTEVTPPAVREVSPRASEAPSVISEVSFEAPGQMTTESKTARPRELFSEESSAGNEPAAERSNEARVLPVQEYEAQAVSPEISETVEIFERRVATQKQPRGRGEPFPLEQPAHRTHAEAASKQAEDREPSGPAMSFEELKGAALSVGASREETFQNYLREIVDWVSAPPVTEAEALEQGPRAPAQTGENLFVVKHDGDAPLASRPGPTEEGPEVQDLNLSIGTISVVIEEQKQQTAVLPPALPPRAESPAAQAATERTSLSRYYLRSW